MLILGVPAPPVLSHEAVDVCFVAEVEVVRQMETTRTFLYKLCI